MYLYLNNSTAYRKWNVVLIHTKTEPVTAGADATIYLYCMYGFISTDVHYVDLLYSR